MRVTSNSPDYIPGVPPQEHSATLNDQHPPLPEGVLFTDEQLVASNQALFTEVGANPVVDIETITPPIRDRFGVTTTELFTLKNGRQHEVVHARPKHQRSDIVIEFTPALGTSIRGHNWHFMQQMQANGFHVVQVGAEGGHANWPTTPTGWARLFKRLATINLHENAQNQHEILDVLDKSYDYAPKIVAKAGESKGMMEDMVFEAQAPSYDRTVAYADVIAGAFPDKFAWRGDSGRIRQGVPKEVKALGKLAFGGKIPLRRLVHYPETLNLNPYFGLHVIASVPTLMSGAAGDGARLIHQGARIHNTVLEDDGMAKGEVWEEIFEDYPMVVTRRVPGGHLDLAQEEQLLDREQRMAGFRDELEGKHHDLDRVDWRNVHMGRVALAA